MVCQRKVFERERILAFAVGQTAGLGAFTAVAAPAPDHGGKQALPRMANAERTMDEQLGFDGGILQKQFQILLADLPCGNHAGKAERLQQFCHFAVVARHLRAGVQFQFGNGAADRHSAAGVGNDQGVHPGGCRTVSGFQKRWQLVIGYQRV